MLNGILKVIAQWYENLMSIVPHLAVFAEWEELKIR